MMNEYFEREMKEILGDEYRDFKACESQPMFRSLRINTLKTNYEEIEKEFSVGRRTPFDHDTYYLDEGEKPGIHPWHTGGLFYLQEPSATMAVNALHIEEGDRILDLCAAPGGKSTQILARLKGTGLLWSNEINRSRAMTLLSNIERWGSDNYILTSMASEELCPKVMGFFDKILVDAPCSGASMFKKYPETVNEYNQAAVEACQKRQLMILDQAYVALKPEGVLVYSTCTYNRLENEEAVRLFTEAHPDMEVVDCGLDCGRKGLDSELMRRCFPMDGGEGHFVCRMVKHGSAMETKLAYMKPARNRIVDEFLAANCCRPLPYYVVNDNVYVAESPLLDFKGRVVRQGILLGNIVGNRFEPHHHGYLAIMTGNNFKQSVDLNEEEAAIFMSGNSVMVSGIRGFTAITYKNHPIGFGKGDGRQIKNRLPKGLRRIAEYQ